MENIALGKATSQSSTKYEGESSRAVDGSIYRDYFKDKTCTHTKGETNPWLKVDLMRPATVALVGMFYA